MSGSPSSCSLWAAAGLAYDRYNGLGHAVLPGWLITRSGSLDRKRHSLEADGVIGWTVRETFFQRRAGVATVIAATPAGTGGYDVIDLPAENALGSDRSRHARSARRLGKSSMINRANAPRRERSG